MSSKLPVRAIAAGLFSAAPELVFDAFLDTRMIGRFMFGPGIRDEEIVSLTNDPRVGGAFAYVVRRKGEEIDHVGEYIEIDRPRHLVFTWAIRQDPSGGGSRVVIDITPVIDGCELTLIHEMPHGWEDFVEKSKEAWGRMIDKLTEILDDVG
ncbi:MAG TPA: SRPBCC family protein [Puia sp.]|jgi:uncharacterized protein YndB with AHSA1/START domain|nr:SRPBCC family protein [Puia sp.]